MGVALITGVSGAIGSAIARRLAERGFEVVGVCRNAERGEAVVDAITGRNPRAKVELEIADLSLRTDIEELARRVSGPIDVLINNAAVAPPKRETTPVGTERVWATNVLSYHWMVEAFRDALARTEGARVINVASNWAGGLDLSDPEFERRPYNNDAAYRQSKQANRMLTVAQAESLRRFGVAVNACHPGDCESRLSQDLGFGGSDSPDDAARTPVFLATQRAGVAMTGRYFEQMQERSCPYSKDTDAIAELFAQVQRY